MTDFLLFLVLLVEIAILITLRRASIPKARFDFSVGPTTKKEP